MLMRSENLMSSKGRVNGRVDGPLISAVAKFLNARWKRASPPGRGSKKLRKVTTSVWPKSVVMSIQKYLNSTLIGRRE